MMRTAFALIACFLLARSSFAADTDLASSPMPSSAKLVLEEDWATGKIDPQRWYIPRKKWGNGNHGVVPENVNIVEEDVFGKKKNVVVCTAHGDQYDGPVVGMWGRKQRVGGVIVSKEFFASGRFEVVMKIGSDTPSPGGPQDPTQPQGSVPAIWTYGYRFVKVAPEKKNQFVAEEPLYNPHMPAYNGPFNEYWSELDFPEFGKKGQFKKPMFNTFLQNRHDMREFDLPQVINGKYHTYTTQWRTQLSPMKGITDEQVVEHLGYWWIRDKSVPFEQYLGNPLKRLGKDDYALYEGRTATHWVDGKKVAENTKWVPAMTAQLTMGIWLPDWAGPAPWKASRVSFASIKVWQFGDEGDVKGVITQDIHNNFEPSGKEIK